MTVQAHPRIWWYSRDLILLFLLSTPMALPVVCRYRRRKSFHLCRLPRRLREGRTRLLLVRLCLRGVWARRGKVLSFTLRPTWWRARWWTERRRDSDSTGTHAESPSGRPLRRRGHWVRRCRAGRLGIADGTTLTPKPLEDIRHGGSNASLTLSRFRLASLR